MLPGERPLQVARAGQREDLLLNRLHPLAVLATQYSQSGRVDTDAVRFHFELLEIVGQQLQPLVIGEYRARLAASNLRVIKVGEGRAHHDVRGLQCVRRGHAHGLRGL